MIDEFQCVLKEGGGEVGRMVMPAATTASPASCWYWHATFWGTLVRRTNAVDWLWLDDRLDETFVVAASACASRPRTRALMHIMHPVSLGNHLPSTRRVLLIVITHVTYIQIY